MGRKRSPEYDYVCRRCGVACDLPGTRHYRGGRSPRACKGTPDPTLRREYDTWMDTMARDAVAAIRSRIRK